MTTQQLTAALFDAETDLIEAEGIWSRSRGLSLERRQAALDALRRAVARVHRKLRAVQLLDAANPGN